MSDEGKLREQAARGARAKALWSNELLQEAFALVEQDLSQAWRNSRLGDAEQREAAYRQLHALEDVKAKLKAAIDTGKVAESLLEKMARKVASAF